MKPHSASISGHDLVVLLAVTQIKEQGLENRYIFGRELRDFLALK